MTHPGTPVDNDAIPLPTSADDFDLLRRIAQRAQSALGELYDRYSGLLLAL